MANADPHGSAAAAWRVVARHALAWSPVLVVYAAILLTVPYGLLVSQTLYRLEPDALRTRREAPPGVVELRDLPGGTLLRAADGVVWWAAGDAPARPLPLPAPCLALAHGRELLATCVLGQQGVAVIDVGQAAEPAIRTFNEPSSSALPVGDRVLVGTPGGSLVVYTRQGVREGEARVSDGPLTSLIAQSGQVAAAHGHQLTVIDLADTTRPEVRGTIPLGGPPGRLSSILTDVYTFVGARVLVIDTSNADDPRLLAELDAGARVQDIHPFLGSVAYVLLDDGRVRTLRNSLYGTFWWGGWARPAEVCAGPWGEVVCITRDGQLERYDVHPSRSQVIIGVAVLGALLFAGVIALAVRRRSPGWIQRLAWVAGVLGLLAWILADTWKIPIEALHILEYTAFGALVYRALGLDGRGGAATAALAAGAGVLAGVGDELSQWANPFRTGSIEDVMLDARAATLGAVLGWKGLSLAGTDRPRSWVVVGVAAAALPLVLAGFLQITARFGQTWTDGPYTVHSRLTRDAWRERDTPASREALARTTSLRYDDYLRRYPDEPWFYEIRVHLYRRDRYVQKGDWTVACAEQRLLDRLAPTAIEGTAYAWGPAQRASCQDVPEVPYTSPVGDDLVTSFTPGAMWALAGGSSALLAALSLIIARRSGRR